MAEKELWVEARAETGKEYAGKLRRQGKIPAVLYGRGREPKALAVESAQVLKILHSRMGRNTILTLHSEDQELNGRKALIRESQIDAITDQLLHIDLMEVTKDRPVRIWVPVEIVGKPVGVEKGGTLEEHMREIEISCLPDEIPEQIKIDVSHLDMGDAIHVRDLKLEKAKILSNPSMAIVSVVAPTRVEEAAPAGAPAEGEAVAPAEGEVAPTEAGAATPASAKPGEKAPAKPAEKAGAKAEEAKPKEKKPGK